MTTRHRLIVPALFSVLLAAACGDDSTGTGAGGSAGGGTGGSSGSAGTGGNATGGNGGGTGGASGAGTGGASGGGTGGAAGSTPDGGTGGAGGVGDASVDQSIDGGSGGSGNDGGLVLGGTPTRPQISSADAARFTILTYLAQTGMVAAPTSDPWDPTPGVLTTTTPDFIVDASGAATGADGGTFTTVQAALDAAIARGGTSRIFIQVLPGTYREVVCVRTGPPITLFSAETDAGTFPTIVFGNLAGTAPPEAGAPPLCFGGTLGATFGTDNSATFGVAGANFQAKNLIISNDGDVTTLTGTVAGQTQGVALHTRGDKALYENVRLLGHQDTLEVKTGNVGTITRSYFKNSYIAGDVDFIFGRATAVFDHCELHIVTGRPTTVNNMNNGPARVTGNVIAPSTNAPNPFGFLVIGSTFTADANATAGGSTLGRAYDEGVAVGDAGTLLNAYANLVLTGTYPNGQAVIRDTTIAGHINATTPWASAATTTRPYSSTGGMADNGGAIPANRLYEFNNTGAGAAQ